MKVLIDNGHGVDTAGKRSPDGRLLEYAYAREIAARLEEELKANGIEAERIVPEDEDISLKERVRRANELYAAAGKEAILVSIHCNAAGDGTDWMSAQGWSAYVAKNASTASKTFASCLIGAAEAEGLKVRKYSPGEPYWTQNLAICRDTNCPAVLTENLFMDNKEDVDYLLSEEGKRAIVALHVAGIRDYLGQS